MKKIFVVCDLEKYKAQESILKRCMSIGFRANDPETGKDVFYKQNVEFYPKDSGKIEFDEQRGEVVIRLKVRRGQFVAVGDEDGMAEKIKLKAIN